MSATEQGAPARLERGSIGRSVPRVEDDRLLRGEGVFVDDVRRHGLGYVHLVRSPLAHARVVSVDVRAAEAAPGVHGTLTGAEVAALTRPYAQLSGGPGKDIVDYCMAVDRVRYAGEPVVAVVAETRELARDAAELVEVEYEELPALVDGRRARDPDAPVLHEPAGTNVVWQGLYDWGDVDGALAAADRVVRISELHFHRFSSTPLEGFGAVVEHDRASGEFTIHCNHQMPGIAAIFMGPALGVPLDRLRFVTRDIGGGFGNKVIVHTYLLILCLLARKLRRPVQWVETRSEQHLAGTHGNERWFRDVEVAVQADGTLLGLKLDVVDDCGAYPRYEPVSCVAWSHVAPGAYRWRNLRVDFTQVVSNKTPVGPNRGFARLQHLWLVERVVDIVAHELGVDPVEMRKRNYVRADEMPYETPNGCVYDSGDYARCLDVALDLVGYERWRERRRAGGGKLVGIGIGTALDSGTNNIGQTRILNPALTFSGNHEVATARLDLFGEIVVALGTVPQGQGHETVAAQVAADALGVAPQDVHVRSGHDSLRNSHTGFSGTYASQFAVTGLGAVKGAADGLAAEIRRLAAAVLGAAGPDEIVLEGGRARRKDDPTAALTLVECGRLVHTNSASLPPDLDVTLNCRYVYRAPFAVPDAERKHGNLALTYATNIHVCVVEVDPRTGEVEIVDYAAADDCGVRIHPQIVEGQVHGATVHGIGAALYEQFAFDEYGQLLTASFLDYHVPRAADVPHIRTGHIVCPSPFTPLGAKGMGEGGGASLHAVCSAIQDALARAGGGVVTDSFNDHERVWRLLARPHESRALVSVERR